MFIIKLADINIKINNKYEFLKKQCQEYIVDCDNYDLVIEVTDEEINHEKEISNQEFSNGYLESVCCYRKLCLEITKFDIFLMHAAVVCVDGLAYAFSAKSGTGKTTHTKLWKELLQDRMSYINGDKPLIRIKNGIPFAYGTPWNGKEGYGTNAKAELKALCFVERDITNSIYELPKKDVLNRILHQILIPSDPIQINQTFNLLNQTINHINTYVLKCNMELEAAKLSFETLSKK